MIERDIGSCQVHQEARSPATRGSLSSEIAINTGGVQKRISGTED
jgi:hypothetical protein